MSEGLNDQSRIFIEKKQTPAFPLMTGFDSLPRKKKPFLHEHPSCDAGIPQHFLGQPGSDSLLPEEKSYLTDSEKRSGHRRSMASDTREIPEWVSSGRSRRHPRLHLFSRKNSIS